MPSEGNSIIKFYYFIFITGFFLLSFIISFLNLKPVFVSPIGNGFPVLGTPASNQSLILNKKFYKRRNEF